MVSVTVLPSSDITTTDWALTGGTGTFWHYLAMNGGTGNGTSTYASQSSGTATNALVLGTGFTASSYLGITGVSYTMHWGDLNGKNNANCSIALLESGSSTQLATTVEVSTAATFQTTTTNFTLQAAGLSIANWANFDIQITVTNDNSAVTNPTFYGIFLTLILAGPQNVLSTTYGVPLFNQGLVLTSTY